jgi:hypothetical protein
VANEWPIGEKSGAGFGLKTRKKRRPARENDKFMMNWTDYYDYGRKRREKRTIPPFSFAILVDWLGTDGWKYGPIFSIISSSSAEEGNILDGMEMEGGKMNGNAYKGEEEEEWRDGMVLGWLKTRKMDLRAALA